jgi:hypothetical protein
MVGIDYLKNTALVSIHENLSKIEGDKEVQKVKHAIREFLTETQRAQKKRGGKVNMMVIASASFARRILVSRALCVRFHTDYALNNQK